MQEFRLEKKDVMWSYIAQFLSMGTGIITLPFILHLLTADEIGFNYILMTVGSVIALVDLGFAPQFARNFTYVFSGVQELKKEGIGRQGDVINYELLGYLLKTARYIYGSLGLLAFILLLIIGTPYIYITTSGFSRVPNCIWIWIVYSLGVLFQVFYSYYFSMLLGAGKIKEQKFALIGNKILYIIITIGGLYAGWGLISVALAQALSPFLGRFLSYYYFYTPALKAQLSQFSCKSRGYIADVFRTLWFNAKRTAVMSIGAFAILRFSMFIAGLYLTLEEFASYGLMIQLVGVLGNVSCTLMQISLPKITSLRSSGNISGLIRHFSIAYDLFILLFIGGSFILIFFGEPILDLIHSNAALPGRGILVVYCIVMLLEYNHSNFASLISTNNKVPFAPASIITGIGVCIGIFLVMHYTTWGILGIVIVQGLCQASYQNWKWPMLALKELHVSFSKVISSAIEKQ